MDRRLAGNGRQVNQSDINRPEFGGWKGQSSALKKAAALVLAASLVLGSAVTSLAEEAGTAAGSQRIEYADLEQLIKGANPEVQAKRADLDHWVGEYEAARDEIMENRTRLREDARELKDDGDLEGSRHYLEQAKMLKESADQLDKQIRSLNSASNTMDGSHKSRY